MDFVTIAKDFGLPVAFLTAVCYFVWHQQTRLIPDMQERFLKALEAERNARTLSLEKLGGIVLSLDAAQQVRHDEWIRHFGWHKEQEAKKKG